MRIFIASDHAGFELKRELVLFLKESGYDIIDKGPFEYDGTDDYPDFVSLAAKEVSKNSGNSRGIIIGGSGQGEAMAANRFSRVRAAVYYGGDEEIVLLSRAHNDANILSLAARFLNEEEAKRAVELWLKTPFSKDERHKRRIRKIDDFANAKRRDGPPLGGPSLLLP